MGKLCDIIYMMKSDSTECHIYEWKNQQLVINPKFVFYLQLILHSYDHCTFNLSPFCSIISWPELNQQLPAEYRY